MTCYRDSVYILEIEDTCLLLLFLLICVIEESQLLILYKDKIIEFRDVTKSNIICIWAIGNFRLMNILNTGQCE